ncbi:MAG: alpha/beta fold hydrolase [Usitatibacter sp.]
MEPLQYVELATGREPVGTVIWLHGLGDSGWGHLDAVRALAQQDLPTLRFILPHAPMRAVTVNNGMEMPAWYDISMIEDIGRTPDEQGIRESQAAVEQLIAREGERGIAAGHIVLAGFSQGGAIALQTGLRHAQRLAGIVAMSTYLTLEDSLDAEAAAANRATPIYMAHGVDDEVIPIALARRSHQALEKRGYSVTWEDFPMPHSLSGEEIVSIGDFLLRVLGDAAVAPARSSILLP